MDKNKKLVPTCIIYIDGVRLNVDCEGAFRSIVVIDPLCNVGECTVTFDFYELGEDNIQMFQSSFFSNLSVHLGYKDDLSEVFNGRVTRSGINHPEYGPSLYKLTATSYLSVLEHGKHTRTFENIAPYQAVKKTLGRYGLQVDCEQFGAEIPYWQSKEKTDFKTVRDIAKYYGRDIRCSGKKVYVKELMTTLKDEHIYEWGKSLIAFEVKESVMEQVRGIRVIGWNIEQAEAVSGEAKIEGLRQKIGGGRPWRETVANKGEKWVNQYHYVWDHKVKDASQAKEIAEGLLREKSFNYMRAGGSGEGNQRLTAGATVTVKYTGASWDGEYIAHTVIHRFSLEEGYTTEFYLKRNMANDG